MRGALLRFGETSGAGRVRFIRVAGDQMEPTLRPHDYVAVVPTDRWHYDSLYVLEALGTPTVYRCQHVGGGQIRIKTDCEAADAQLVPMERFQELVLGIMNALVNMEGHPLFALVTRGASTRRQLEDLIERAIDALDAMDSDPDMEPDADGEDSHDQEYDVTDVEVHFWPAVVGPQDCCPLPLGRDRS